MTLVLTVTCDGYWDGGRMPCRGAFPFPLAFAHVGDQLQAFSDAADAAGWADGKTEGTHLCPAHARLTADR